MAGHSIDGIIESLFTGGLDIAGFMRAVQKKIESLEDEPQR